MPMNNEFERVWEEVVVA